MGDGMTRFSCPICRANVKSRAANAGRQVKCQTCGNVMIIPAVPAESTVIEPDLMPPAYTPAVRPPPPPRTAGKTCPYCAEQIAGNAIKCKHCGSALVPIAPLLPWGAAAPFAAAGHLPPPPPSDPYSAPGIIKTPLLVSAIGNVVLAIFWIGTIFLFFLAIPCIVLCVFEFRLYAQAEDLHPRDFARRAQTLAIFEVIVGLFNMIALVCGIVVLVNAPAVKRRNGGAHTGP